MSLPAYTRVSDLGVLPDLIATEAVARIAQDQGIPSAILEDPGAVILYRDCVGLYQRAADITANRTFGLRVSAGLGICDLGLYGKYIAAAPDLERSLICARDYVRFHESQSIVDFELAGDDVRFLYRSGEQGAIGWRHAADMVLCMLVDLIRSYVRGTWRPKRIEVSYPRGAWMQDLEDHFGVPVHFDMPAVAIVFSRDLLRVPRSVDLPSNGIVTSADVMRDARPLPWDFLGATSDSIRKRLMIGKTDLDGLAEKLGIGPRALQRRLSNEGVTYRRILQRCLAVRATELLREEALSVNDAAKTLGYASETEFIRAFKKWYGVTPGTFRTSRCNAR